MALSDYLKRGQIGPSFSRSFYQYERNGRWVTAKWPNPRGKPKSEKQALAQQAFSEVCKAIKRTASEIQMYHRENAKGTPMLPRDSMMAALYGNGPTLTYYSGKVIKPMANKLLASTVLDAIGWQQGAILFRGDDTWEVINPGEAGQSLISKGANEPPEWRYLGSGSGGLAFFYPVAGSISGSSFCTKGVHFKPVHKWRIDSLYFQHQAAVGDILDLRVCFIADNGVVLSIPLELLDVAVGDGAVQFVDLLVPSPVFVPAGQRVAVLLSTRGKASNFITRLATGTLSAPTFPLLPPFGYVNQLAVKPVVGMGLSLTSGSPYFVGVGLS